ARMNLPNEVEILLVEDNPHDEELTLRALKERNIANQLFVARDGAEALDFFFGDGTHPWREIGIVPRVVLLALQLPKVDGLAAPASAAPHAASIRRRRCAMRSATSPPIWSSPTTRCRGSPPGTPCGSWPRRPRTRR